MTSVNYPSHYPANCPPADVITEVGRIYRFATANPDDVRDAENFEPHYNGTATRPFPPQMLCQACGLSVFTDVNEIPRLKRLPLFRQVPVAILEPPIDSGAIKNTPSSRTGNDHHTYWVADGIALELYIVGEMP